MKFSDVSFKHKILMLLALPMLGFLWLSFSSISQSIETRKEMSTLTELTHLSVEYSELVHELQKERGMTAGFIGSNGSKFSVKLRKQRADTDAKQAKMMRFWQQNEFSDNQIQQLHMRITQDLSMLTSIRNKVDAQNIELASALRYYTQLNAKLLSVSGLIVDISSDASITAETIAYYNFLQGKERAGIERAVLSNVFSKDHFATDNFVKFISLVVEQETYFLNFKTFATSSNNNFFVQQLNTPAVKEVMKLRHIAETNSTEFNVDAEYWFSQASARIGQLKLIEDDLERSLLTLADNHRNSAVTVLMMNVVFSVLIIVIVVVISFITIRDLMSRVNELMDVMTEVRDNNDLTVQTKLAGESELGQIASALNLTLSQFAGAMDNISTSSITLASAAEETAQTCDYSSKSLAEQQDGISLIATAIEELSATVKEVAQNTQLTADSAKEVDTQAVSGFEIVQQSSLSIEGLACEIDSLAQRITNLHTSSNNITNMVDVIKSVADQTNLLALNAAIEAARAGEQGRGFAVVADEVRTLAKRTQESTAEIESFISALQADADAAFNVIEVSQTKASEAVSNSQDVAKTLQDITASVNQIFSMTEQIATAIEEQSVVTQDVAKNIVDVKQKSMESATGSAQIAMTAKEQAQLATSLQDIAKVFKI
ncbi:methyl-accepting chemotaxis protein [Moritella viscosa]|uniref:Methyl-accepting chemotaxis protein n=2 Tax=Moritella viscosa TaxID=80854 RepID=A0ABY1HLT1_9GAMM|nr:methyl-accepting chemotaxis protein [Moritella viscosa]SGZ03705.1 Methyl-accepting chemotaxis protein [Moritella viscosa]SGZ17875.1 Methyl-accepting chemotaxis protein [Moritella viscosa]SHO28330.1 Methyl-accepting chemotaxis protein [Moritella viscosa]